MKIIHKERKITFMEVHYQCDDDGDDTYDGADVEDLGIMMMIICK